MNLAADIKPISYLKAKTADAISYVNDSHNPLIITQNGEAKAVIQDIESYQNMKNAIAMLKLLAEGEGDIRNDRYESQESFFEKMEQKLTENQKPKSIPRPPDCDKEIVDAIEKNDVKYFRAKKESIKELNYCLASDELTPLMIASYVDRPAIVRVFMEAGLTPNEYNSKKYFPIHFAAMYGNFEIVEILLSHGADIESKNVVGQTPLMAASFYGNAKTASILLRHGAKKDAVDNAGKTAADFAKERHKKEALAVLTK